MVFYGEPSESHDAELKGKLILNNPESLSVRCVRITLTATRKVSYAKPQSWSDCRAQTDTPR